MSLSGAATAEGADAALDGRMWAGFFDEMAKVAILPPPATKGLRRALSAGGRSAITGKPATLAKSSGAGQTSLLGRSGTSALTAPPPSPISG